MEYVISLGGSIIVPDEIDTRFVKKFTTLILREVKKGHKFFVVTGGGATARKYIKALRVFRRVPDRDLDWIGISATKMNAQLLLSAFGPAARKKLIVDPSHRFGDLKKINLVSGWKPGWSTDYVATRIAQTYGLKMILNLSNIDYVYTADPRRDKHAKKILQMTWTRFRKQFGSTWDPGANVPFDPVAAKLAQRLGLRVILLNGKKFKNLENLFRARRFKGTIIQN